MVVKKKNPKQVKNVVNKTINDNKCIQLGMIVKDMGCENVVNGKSMSVEMKKGKYG
jgi:hypothetical protein